MRRLIADIDTFAILQCAGKNGFRIRCGSRIGSGKGKDAANANWLISLTVPLSKK